MTITTQDLIDAARAIGIEVKLFTALGGLEYLGYGEGIAWAPHKDKSQLMDLQWGLKLDVRWDKKRAGHVEFFQLLIYKKFDNTFESFATAIILAAAEIGRAK